MRFFVSPSSHCLFFLCFMGSQHCRQTDLHSWFRSFQPFAGGLIGQTWFMSCLFFMKLRPQKWQVPVFLYNIFEVRYFLRQYSLFHNSLPQGMIIPSALFGKQKKQSINQQGSQKGLSQQYIHFTPGFNGSFFNCIFFQNLCFTCFVDAVFIEQKHPIFIEEIQCNASFLWLPYLGKNLFCGLLENIGVFL